MFAGRLHARSPHHGGVPKTLFRFFLGLPLQGCLRRQRFKVSLPGCGSQRPHHKQIACSVPSTNAKVWGAQRGSSSLPCEACTRSDQKLAPERPVKQWGARRGPGGRPGVQSHPSLQCLEEGTPARGTEKQPPAHCGHRLPPSLTLAAVRPEDHFSAHSNPIK